jgi:hypothetical protein
VAIVVVALIGLANAPLTTLRGVNFVVSPHRLPAYVKAVDFVDRHVNYGRLADQITAAADSDAAKLQAVFEWTRANVRDTPNGFPIVDDHPWNIVVRGYGEPDQKSDVFTVLLSYAGVRAYWIAIGPGPELMLSLALVDGRWRPVDVENGVVFKNGGNLATVEDLAADRQLASRQGPASYEGVRYGTYFERFRPPIAPDITRAEEQMPSARAWFEMRRLVGRRGQAWEMRPASRAASR